MKVVCRRWCRRVIWARLDAQLGIKIRERLVKEEDLRLAHDGATDGDALTLTTGELLRLAIEQVADVKNVGGFLYAAFDFGLGRLAELEAECHVVVNTHVRVKSVRLEDHGDVTILGRYVVYDAIANQNASIADLFETGKQAQAGRLATTRRTDEDEEFLVGDRDVQVVDGGNIAPTLVHMLKRD